MSSSDSFEREGHLSGSRSAGPKTARGYSVCALHPLACSRQQGRLTVYFHRLWWLDGLSSRPATPWSPDRSPNCGRQTQAPVTGRRDPPLSNIGIPASEPLTPIPLDYVPSSLSLALTTKADTNVTEAYSACLAGSYSLSRDLPTEHAGRFACDDGGKEASVPVWSLEMPSNLPL